MPTKLNQIIAVVNGKKTRVQKGLTELYHKLQKAELFSGLSRRYTPLDDEGETLPPETTLVKVKVEDVISEGRSLLSELIDVVATQDYANCVARADVVVDDKVVLKDVPVTHLLFLEKQLVDLATFIEKFPTLDPSEEWSWDASRNCFATRPSQTVKTKKVMRNHVLAEATDKHPAQVQTYNEDVKIGEWSTTKFSGSIEPATKSEMLARVRKLQDGVKQAREAANNSEVSSVKVAESLLSYVFAK